MKKKENQAQQSKHKLGAIDKNCITDVTHCCKSPIFVQKSHFIIKTCQNSDLNFPAKTRSFCAAKILINEQKI